MRAFPRAISSGELRHRHRQPTVVLALLIGPGRGVPFAHAVRVKRQAAAPSRDRACRGMSAWLRRRVVPGSWLRTCILNPTPLCHSLRQGRRGEGRTEGARGYEAGPELRRSSLRGALTGSRRKDDIPHGTSKGPRLSPTTEPSKRRTPAFPHVQRKDLSTPERRRRTQERCDQPCGGRWRSWAAREIKGREGGPRT